MGMRGGEILKVLPMHRRAVAVQEARTRKDPRGRVDAAHQLEAGRDAAQVVDQGPGGDFGQTVARDDDQRIGTHGMRERAGGRQFEIPQVSGTGWPSGETTRQR
jgi:hypothetical protein